MKRAVVLTLIGLAWAMPASAGVNAFKFAQVDNSAGGAELAGYVTNDILIDFTGQWTGAQALMGPFDAGSIYQHPSGGIRPPEEIPIPIIDPALVFDTYVVGAAPDPIEPVPPELRSIIARKFDDREIDVAWSPGGGEIIMDQTDFPIMRLTLRNDVNGTAAFLASAGGDPSTVDGFIHNGILSFVPFVPEPASGLLVGVALAIGAALVRVTRGASRYANGSLVHNWPRL
jgi:hypothetical protein